MLTTSTTKTAKQQKKPEGDETAAVPYNVRYKVHERLYAQRAHYLYGTFFDIVVFIPQKFSDTFQVLWVKKRR